MPTSPIRFRELFRSNKVTLVIVANLGAPRPPGVPIGAGFETPSSVWAIAGEYDFDKEETPFPTEHPAAIRIVGPAKHSLCVEVQENIGLLLEAVGVEVQIDKEAIPG